MDIKDPKNRSKKLVRILHDTYNLNIYIRPIVAFILC